MQAHFNTGDLADCRVGIFGLGLMGGSLALALRGKCQTVMGLDPDPATRDLAKKWGVVDMVTDDPAAILPRVDLLVLATPVTAILQWLKSLPDLQPGGLMLLDLGSTKVQILAAMQELPDRFDPLGGHPMCGKEKSSLAHAEAVLFHRAPFAFTPLPRTSWRLRRLADEITEAIGATPLWLDADTHDRWTAVTSHLPYLSANALAYITPQEARPLAGPGYRSTTRLAVSSLTMMIGILATNRENVLVNLRNLREHLGVLESSLEAQDWQALSSYLAAGAERQAAIVD
jgi:prephenate dehydrogenase